MSKGDGLIPITERSEEERKEFIRKGIQTKKKKAKQKKATRELIMGLLSMTPYIDKKTEQALEQVGYDPEEMGLPTLETLALLKILNNAALGDIPSLEMLYKYGQIPDMNTQIKREALKVEREKNRGGNDTSQSLNNMATIAELIMNPQPNIDIENVEVDRVTSKPTITDSGMSLPEGDEPF